MISDIKETLATNDARVCAGFDAYGSLSRARVSSYLRARQPLRHLYRLVAEYPRRGGRLLRPSICVATAVALGGKAEHALVPATAIELLHNAFLVHDDVEDESEFRRGQPTLHEAYGVPHAVNAGDRLCLLAMESIADQRDALGEYLSLKLDSELRRAAIESTEGQAIELGWRSDNAMFLSDEDYLEMILKKTCWYTIIFPLRSGALVAVRKISSDAYLNFGFFLGAAFQIQDDILNLIGDESRYGKEINGDLLEGKRTMMLLHVIRSVSFADRNRLMDLLRLPRDARTSSDVVWIREQMERHGSIEHAQTAAHVLAGAAITEFDRAFNDVPDSESKEFLRSLCTWVLTRA